MHTYIHLYTCIYMYIYFIYIFITTYIYIHMYPIWLSSAPCLEHSGDINYSLLVDPSCTDESWEGWNLCLRICMPKIYLLGTLENTDEKKLYVCLFTTSNLGKFSILLRALWWRQLFSACWRPGKDKTCIYIIYII